MKLRYRPSAHRDIEEAREWYAAQSPELEARFAGEVADTLAIVLEYPLAFPVARGNVRRVPLPVFPYLVYYLPQSDQLTILRVLHTKRHPDTWRRG